MRPRLPGSAFLLGARIRRCFPGVAILALAAVPVLRFLLSWPPTMPSSSPPVVALLIVCLLCLAHLASLRAFSPPAADVVLPIALPLPGLALTPASDRGVEPGCGNSAPSAVEGLADGVVSTWNEQVLEWDELTRCIRGSATGNAIERWLDCLESLEQLPALKPSETRELPQSGVSAETTCSDAAVNGSLQLGEDNMVAFDPLSGGSVKSKSLGSFDRNSQAIEGLGYDRGEATANMAQEGFLDETQKFESAAVSEDAGTVSRIGRGDEIKGVAQFLSGSSASSDAEISEKRETSASQILSDGNKFPVIDDSRGATDVRRSSSKWGTDISSVSGDSQSLPNSVCNDDNVGCLEVRKETPSSMTCTKRSQNLLDALKLAACLGAAATLMWKKKDRLRTSGIEKQPVLSERAMEYPCPSATGFSMTGLSSSNTDIGYPNVKAGSLSTPLGMAIATVMAEALEQEHREKAPRTADELSKLLEVAMTESLSPVMGSECPGFVEQFKQSFRSTYRLLGSVRNAGRNPAPFSYPNYSGGFSQRRAEGPSRRYSRRTDDEDDNGGLTSSSRGVYLNLVSESDSRLQSRRDLDSETELAEQLSKLTVSAKGPETGATMRHSGTVAPRTTMDGPCGGENSSHIDQVDGEFDDVSSPLRRNTAERMLSEKGSGDGGSQVYHNGVRSRWERGGLEQLANAWGTDGMASQSAYQQIVQHQGGSSLESGDLDLALQPFGVIPPSQIVAVSDSRLSHHGDERHYKQRKIVLMEQEMHLKKMELAYKFRDLNLKEANLHLSSENNSLMRENVDLSRNKAEFKEAVHQDRKLTAAYTIFAKRCADELVAGLCVMLFALFFGAWKYSYDRLVDVVSTCQPVVYEPSNSYVPGMNMFVNSINHMSSQFHMFLCEVTVASRMFLGLLIISFVAASLLRKSVTTNSQAMPATILIVVLGGICGFAGKFAVDSMGGSGYHWLFLWEIFCLVHTAATCFTAKLYRILNGAPPSATGKRHRQPYFMKPWLRKFSFHVTTVLVLPILAGLLPFAHVREIVEVLGFNLWNLTYLPIESYLRKTYQFSFL